jgi:hypothetical protein
VLMVVTRAPAFASIQAMQWDPRFEHGLVGRSEGTIEYRQAAPGQPLGRSVSALDAGEDRCVVIRLTFQ